MARLPWGAALALWGSLALCDSRPEADIEGDDDAYKYSGSAGFEQVAYSGDLETAAGIYEPLRPEEDPCVMYMDYTDVRRGWVHRMVPPGGSSTDIVLNKWEEAHMAPGKPKHWYLPGNSSIGVKCYVHGCEHPRAKQLLKRKQCDIRRGHLANVGEQADQKCVRRMAKPTARNFFKFWAKRQVPVVIKGAVRDWPSFQKWRGAGGDEYMKGWCRGWKPSIERHKEVRRNDRGPFFSHWDMCDFLERYRLPKYNNSLYIVSTIGSADPAPLRDDCLLPEVVSCPELADSVSHVGLWMSGGGTSSSIHFDTADNILAQVDGEKTVIVADPLYSRESYVDHHNKFGLSPIHTEHVDLEKWPLAASIPWFSAELEAGDALYIPENWWHHVRSRKRNISVNLDIQLFTHMQDRWSIEAQCYYSRSTFAEGVLMLREYMKQYKHELVTCERPLGGGVPISQIKVKEDTGEAPPIELIVGADI